MFTPSFSTSARWVGGAGVVLAATALGLAGCRDKTPDPDPCQGQLANPLTLRFIEAFGTPTPDTAYNNQPMLLEAPGAPYTSYKWLVGQVDERTGRRVGVSFDNKTLGTIPVRLIATRPPNKACFKNDDGVYTLTKTLTLVPERDLRAPIYGQFRGLIRTRPAIHSRCAFIREKTSIIPILQRLSRQITSLVSPKDAANHILISV